MSRHPWSDLAWWNSGERQVIEEKLDDLAKRNMVFYPAKRDIYRGLSATPFDEVRVAIIGQDPYPTGNYATGIAFASSVERTDLPQSLRIIFKEYNSDLGYPVPHHGDLVRWTSQGVLLWNTIPTVGQGLPLSHDWTEYGYLTREIISRLSDKGIVFAFLGAVARRNEGLVDLNNSRVIVTSHPSPRGIHNSRTPFLGSRLFSTINAKLVELGMETINWRLDDAAQTSSDKSKLQGSSVDGGRVLPNLHGLPAPKLKAVRRSSWPTCTEKQPSDA